ncbi:MAG: 4Fe-4S dicluster domain-containing protein [Candidatus Kariarchaeaceae archaeon]|jgi:MinD superfamily P-loop ATPase
MVTSTKSSPAVITDVKQEILNVPELDASKCNGCGMCTEVCPQNVFVRAENGTYQVKYPERCIECGACELNCRGEAITFDPFPGCGCIWNATFRRLKNIAFWRTSTSESNCSSSECK